MIEPIHPIDLIDPTDPTYPEGAWLIQSAQQLEANAHAFSPFEPQEEATSRSDLDLPSEHGQSPRMATVRTPNFADSGIFLALLVMGFVVATSATGVALHFHLFGLRDIEQAKTDTHVAIGTQLLIYVVALAAAIPLYRAAWGKGFLAGVHWHFGTARRLFVGLVGIAILANLLAVLGNLVLPFPKHAPIDQMFGTRLDAWLLFAFGVTVAPFFEEMIFRGFLLPSIATAWDWCVERLTETAPRPLDAEGNPVWSVPAMIFASLAVSAPFALMHSAQLAASWGPLVLLYCVSLILCTVRLITRSLAASALVHSTYNFVLFGFMFVETDGFRHLEKM